MRRQEKRWLAEFSCETARCCKPADRAMILASIRDKEAGWGSEQAFDAFVHNELPNIFAESKQRYQRQLSRVAAESFELLFGD